MSVILAGRQSVGGFAPASTNRVALQWPCHISPQSVMFACFQAGIPSLAWHREDAIGLRSGTGRPRLAAAPPPPSRDGFLPLIGKDPLPPLCHAGWLASFTSPQGTSRVPNTPTSKPSSAQLLTRKAAALSDKFCLSSLGD